MNKATSGDTAKMNLAHPRVSIVPTHDDIVWAAGFFDGEGSCGVYRRRSRGKLVIWQYHATAAVSQSYTPTLYWHRDRWGGHVTAPSLTLNPSMFTNKGSSFFSMHAAWAVSHKLLRKYLLDIEPYVKQKRLILLNVLRFTDSMGTMGGYMKGLPAAVYAEQVRLYERHRELRLQFNRQRGKIPRQVA